MAITYKKPTWVSVESWDAYLATHADASGSLSCHICGGVISPHLHQPDHQIPRSHWVEFPGDVDNISGCLPSHATCNRERSNGPSATWSKRLVFDDPINIEKARTSQREFLVEQIDRWSDWYSVPYGNINSRIQSFFQIVGAGKTIGIGLLPYALNAASKKHYPQGGPRVKKMLVLTKDQSLRKQLASELSTELMQYGLVPRTPAILELDQPTRQIQGGEIWKSDIVVAHPSFLWTKDDEPSAYVDLILSNFQLVVFDEVHWAYSQILSLLNKAKHRHVLLFGFTASPVTACGDTLDHMAKFQTYSYQTAVYFDQSMKGIYKQPDSLHTPGYDFDDMIDIVRADRFRNIHGEEIVLDRSQQTANSGMVAIESIISATLQRMYELDKLNDYDGADVSWHRHDLGKEGLDVITENERFYSHAIIRVEGQDACEQVAASINSFIAKRPHLAKSQGYTAVFASGAKPLDNETSPFFYSVRNDGRVSAKAARILVVDGLAREGMNNRYVNINAWCKPTNSIVEACQCLGRAVRSTSSFSDDRLVVPKRDHDRLHIIIHESHEGISVPTLKNALHFLANMEARTDAVMTVDEYFSRLSEVPSGERENAAYLSPHEKRQIVILCQNMLTKKGRVSPENIAVAFTDNKLRIEKVCQFVVRLMHYDPTRTSEVESLKSELHLRSISTPMSIVDMEHRDSTVDGETLKERIAVLTGYDRGVVDRMAEVTPDGGANYYMAFSSMFSNEEDGIIENRSVMSAIERAADRLCAQVQKYEPARKAEVEIKHVVSVVSETAIEKISESVGEVVTPDMIAPGGRFDTRCFYWQLQHESPRECHRSNLMEVSLRKLYEAGTFPKLSKFIGG
jgi:hypothetical protein